MIIEIIHGRAFLDGEPWELTGACRLKPAGGQDYGLDTDAAGAAEDEQWIGIDADRSTVTINTSWYGEHALFYHVGEGYFALASEFPKLVFGMKRRGLGLSLDRSAVFESMIFDIPLRSRTLFNEIRKALPGRRITYDWQAQTLDHDVVFVLPFDTGRRSVNQEKLLNEAVDVLSGLISAEEFEGNRILLPLSGGLDSRLIACLLKRAGLSFETVTFGPRESTEIGIARRVARQLGVPNRWLPLENHYYKKYGDEATWLTGGLSSHMHCHMYACFSESRIQADCIFHGYLGDVYAGYVQPPVSSRLEISQDEAVDEYIRAVLATTWIWQQLPGEDRDAIIGDLHEIMEENCRANLPCQFRGYLHNVDRQSGLITNIFAPVEKFGRFVRPFVNKSYAEFFNALPYEYRKGRRLYKAACSKMFPAEFGIGTADQIHDPSSVSGRIERALSYLRLRVSYASLLVSKGRLAIRNPKGFERHKEILLRTLYGDFSAAIASVSDLMRLDLRHLRGMHPREQFETVAQYRVLSLHTLLEQLRAQGIGVDRGSA